MVYFFVSLGALVFFMLMDLSGHLGVYGPPIKKNIRKRILARLWRYNERLGNKALYVTGLPYIAKVSSFLFPYYVKDIGVVFRYSELSKAIKQKFKELPFSSPSTSLREEAIQKFYND